MAKKNISFPMLIGAVVIGLLAAFLSVVYLKYKERQLQAMLKGPKTQQIEVVVASGDLPKGTVLSANNLAVRPVPAEFVHPNVITPDKFEAIDGRMLIQPLAKGRPLLDTFIVGKLANDFSDTISNGRRAMTIQVDELNAIGGHARPGNHIDIYALLPGSLKVANKADLQELSLEEINKLVVPVLQDIVVLATGKRAHGEFAEKYQQEGTERARDKRNFSNITVDVTPEQASLLAQAIEYGDLLTLLRNRDDRGSADFKEVTTKDLFQNAITMLKEARSKKQRMQKTKDGFYVTEDGKVMTADGKLLEGVTVNENGEVVASDGTVLKASDIVVNEDGSVTTRDGQAIAGVTGSNAILAEDGTVITGVTKTKDGFYVTEDGKVMTADGRVLEGVTLNENGEVVASDGTVLKADEVLVNADGSVAKKTKDGFYVTADGKVMTADGKLLAGVSMNENGEIVTKDGKVLKADDIVMNADGTVSTKDGKLLAGVSASDSDFIADEQIIEFLAGGNSKNGIAIKGQLPVIGQPEQGAGL